MPSLSHSQYDVRYQSDSTSTQSPPSHYTRDDAEATIVDSYYHESRGRGHVDTPPQADSWDTRSNKSYTTYHSQAPLNPQYEMSQASLPSMPSLNYQGSNYPPPPSPYTQPGLPYSRPTLPHSPSSSSTGWTKAREKLMKRRVCLFTSRFSTTYPTRYCSPSDKSSSEKEI